MRVFATDLRRGYTIYKRADRYEETSKVTGKKMMLKAVVRFIYSLCPEWTEAHIRSFFWG